MGEEGGGGRFMTRKPQISRDWRPPTPQNASPVRSTAWLRQFPLFSTGTKYTLQSLKLEKTVQKYKTSQVKGHGWSHLTTAMSNDARRRVVETCLLFAAPRVMLSGILFPSSVDLIFPPAIWEIKS